MKIKRLTIIQFVIMIFAFVCSINIGVQVYAGTTFNPESNLQTNQNLLGLLSYSQSNNLKGMQGVYITEPQKQEIKLFVEQNIVKNETNDYKKAQLISDWIVENIEYGSSGQIGLDPYDVFTIRRAVCGGYSNLYKAMLSVAGIPSIAITGDSSGGGHAWNAVYADNRWFFADTTWGKQFFDQDIVEFSKGHLAYDAHELYVESKDGLVYGFHYDVAVVGVSDNRTEVIIPEKFQGLDVTSIAADLFTLNNNIKKVEVSSKIKYIDTQCSFDNLEAFEVANENTIFASMEGVLFSKDLSEILVYPSEKKDVSFTIPRQTNTYDAKDTFDNSYLNDLYVQNGNTSYVSYDGAIYNLDKTKLLTVPNGKTKLEVLGSVILDNVGLSFKKQLQEITLLSGVTEIPDGTFSGSGKISRIMIPTSVNIIGEKVFENLVGITIYGEAGSYAEQYAKENQITFIIENVAPPIPVKNGWIKEGDNMRYYENDEPVPNKWVDEPDGIKKYTDANGYMVKGWKQIDGKDYYFNEDGLMAKGWEQIAGEKYYFNQNGEMQKGWQIVNNKWYLLAKDGKMLTGWQIVNKKWYLLAKDGTMLAGWQKVSGQWYLLAKDGQMLTGWQKVSGKWYLLAKNGKMLASWQKVNGKWYLLAKDGQMLTGWKKDGGKWYLLAKDGKMLTGWQKVSGKWYYMSSNGKMTTGWVKLKKSWYYLRENGIMATGWIRDGKKSYYLDRSSGVWNGSVK